MHTASALHPSGSSGFSFYKNRGIRIRLAPKSVKRVKQKLRMLTGRSQNMDERIRQLNAYLQGWMGYYALSDAKSVFAEIEGWLKRRLVPGSWMIGKAVSCSRSFWADYLVLGPTRVPIARFRLGSAELGCPFPQSVGAGRPSLS